MYDVCTICTCTIVLCRYYAIVKEPLLYQGRATLWRTGLMIGLAWTVGGVIGFCSVYSGIYTTEGLDILHHQRGQCEFEVSNANICSVLCLKI